MVRIAYQYLQYVWCPKKHSFVPLVSFPKSCLTQSVVFKYVALFGRVEHIFETLERFFGTPNTLSKMQNFRIVRKNVFLFSNKRKRKPTMIWRMRVSKSMKYRQTGWLGTCGVKRERFPSQDEKRLKCYFSFSPLSGPFPNTLSSKRPIVSFLAVELFLFASHVPNRPISCEKKSCIFSKTKTFCLICFFN